MAELSSRKGSAGDTPADQPTADDTAAANPADGGAAESEPAAAESKPADAEPTEAKTAEPEAKAGAKPADPKPDTEPADTEPADTEPADTEPSDTEPSGPKPAAAKAGAAAAAAPVQKDPITGEDIGGDSGPKSDVDPGGARGSGGVSADALSAAAATYAEPVKVRKQRSRPPALVLALSALLVLLLIGAGLLGWQRYQAGQAKEDRTLALQTARDVAGNLTTITSENFSGQIDALGKISTNSFKEQMTGYSAMFGALLKQGNVALRGTVTSAGLEKLEGDKAAALITVSTLITSGQQPQGVPQSFGLLVSLQRDGDRWLASNVDFLR